MSKLQIVDLNSNDSEVAIALKDQIKDLTEHRQKNIVGGIKITITISISW